MEISKGEHFFKIKFNEKELKNLFENFTENSKKHIKLHVIYHEDDGIVFTKELYFLIRKAMEASSCLTGKGVYHYENLEIREFFEPFI